jgi:hypothetical protein
LLTILEDSEATHASADQDTNTSLVQLGVCVWVGALLQACHAQGLLA